MVAEQPFRSTLDVADMAEYMQRVGEQSSEPLVEEWNLLSVVYKNAIDSRRAAWRVITSIEQNEKPEGKEQLASHAREYIAEMEGELQKIRDGILALMDKNLIPSANTDKSKVLYYKMKSDYYRYLAECATGGAKGKATEDTCVACAEATKIAENPVRLAMDTKRSLKTRCSETNEEFDRRVVGRQAELKAVIDAICTFNSDTSFDTHDKTVSTDFLQMSPLAGEQEDLEADTAKHSSILETAMFRVTLDDETSNLDRTLQCTAEQISDVTVPEMGEQLVEVPETVSQDRIRQRAVEQIIENPANSVAEMIVEVPVIQTPERTQQVVNTHVQHVVNAVEAEKPKIIELTVQRKRPIIQEKINQVTKHIEIPESQFSDKVDDMPVVVQRQASMVQKIVQKTMEIPQLQCVDKVVDDSVVQVPQIHVVEKTVEGTQLQIVEKTVKTPETQKPVNVPHVQHIDKVVGVPVVLQRQAPTIQTEQKTTEVPQIQCLELLVDVPVVTQQTAEIPQVPFIDRICQVPVVMQETVKPPRIQFIDRVVDVPVMAQRPGPSRKKEVEEVHRIVEVPRVIPQERIVKPAGERASVRERVKQFERNGGASCSNNVEVPRVAPGDRQSEEAEDEAPSKRRKQESDIEPQIPVHFSLCDGSSEQEAKSVDDSAELETRVRGECEGVSVARLGDILSEMRDVKTELLQVRELVGVLVRRERHAEVKTEAAVRRLDRMEREKDDADDAEREADLQEALTDQSKVVKLIVDKWFVDKGFGFGRTTTGEVVFIHASVVQGAEVLMVGTDAWAQVVNDDARAQGGYRARRAWGQDAWQAEKNKEKANKVAQQVRRAAALTAELAAQSEKKTAAVCDQPPGLDELAGHIEAPNMGAGGSHPQATMMPDPWATFKSPSVHQTTVISPLPASQSFSNFSGKSRTGRSRSSTRAQDNVAMLEETMRLVVEATGKDEASARQQLVNKRPAELLQARDFWRTRVEEKQRFQAKKKEAWEFFRRVPSFRPNKQEHFEEEFKQKVMTGYSSGSPEGRERYLDEWTAELQKKALEVDRRLEAKERVKMGEEDAGSKRRTEWERIFERSPFLIAAS